MDPQLSLQMKEILWSTIQTWLIYLEFFVYIWHALFVNLWHALFMNFMTSFIYEFMTSFIYIFGVICFGFFLGYRVFNLILSHVLSTLTHVWLLFCVLLSLLFFKIISILTLHDQNFYFTIHMLQYTFILLINIPDCLVFVVGCFWVLLLKGILWYTIQT